MIIKEYRIPLPMTVEEYRIAQLYMIQVGRGAGWDTRSTQMALSTLGGGQEAVGSIAALTAQCRPSWLLTHV